MIKPGVSDVLLRGYKTVRDLCVPPQCLMCETILSEQGGCCAKCWSMIWFLERPFCEVTGAPFGHDLGEGMVSAEAIANPPPYRRCRSSVLYDENVKRLVTGLKYSDRLDLAPWMAGWMITAGSELFESDPLIVPVPLFRWRHVSRRYNQSSELARHIANKKCLSFRPDLLERHRYTRQQVGLGSKERERNVQGAFRVSKEKQLEIKSRSILLIDDVYTSGATVKAATRALRRAGSGDVDVLTFARVETVE